MKHKTAELSGVNLNHAVALAEGLHIDGIRAAEVIIGTTPNRSVYAPCQNWTHGGPIIERNFIQIYRNSVRDASGHFNGWIADCPRSVELEPRPKAGPGCQGVAMDPLTAAMLAFVASKFGEFVEIDSYVEKDRD